MTKGFIAGATGKILAYGTVLAVFITGVLFFAMNSPQCPDSYTQEQINTSDCIVGANVGIGLVVISIPLIWAISVYIISTIIRQKPPDDTNKG